MARLFYVVPFALALIACGSKSSDTPDAPVIMTTDAHPPDAPPPDAFSCAAPLQECTAMSCSNVSSDEQNCGSCGNACKGGEFCSAAPKLCACPSPANFFPAKVGPGIADQNQVVSGVAQIAIGPTPGTAGLNALVAVVSASGGTQTGMDYTLSAPSGGLAFPVVAAAYGLDVSNPQMPSADAQYVAVSGTVNFDAICATEVKGTLTDVTFQGATGSFGGGLPMVDPNGCKFTIAKLPFDIKSGAACQ